MACCCAKRLGALIARLLMRQTIAPCLCLLDTADALPYRSYVPLHWCAVPRASLAILAISQYAYVLLDQSALTNGAAVYVVSLK
jgi:hypothetical protein